MFELPSKTAAEERTGVDLPEDGATEEELRNQSRKKINQIEPLKVSPTPAGNEALGVKSWTLEQFVFKWVTEENAEDEDNIGLMFAQGKFSYLVSNNTILPKISVSTEFNELRTDKKFLAGSQDDDVVYEIKDATKEVGYLGGGATYKVKFDIETKGRFFPWGDKEHYAKHSANVMTDLATWICEHGKLPIDAKVKNQAVVFGSNVSVNDIGANSTIDC